MTAGRARNGYPGARTATRRVSKAFEAASTSSVFDLPFEIASVGNGAELRRDGSRREIEVSIPEGQGGWSPVDLTLRLRR